MVRFETLSVMTPGTACNARCPFCVAKMTPTQGTEKGLPLDIRNVRKACRLAEMMGVTTALITGKGEPTLHVEDVAFYIRTLGEESRFPLVELQTNGILLTRNPGFADILRNWHSMGLTTVCLSVAHWLDEKNHEIYQSGDGYPPLDWTIRLLHDCGLSVRLSVAGLKGYVDAPAKLIEMADYCRANEVEQLTWRWVTVPKSDQVEVIRAAESFLPVREQRSTMDAWVARQMQGSGDAVMTPLMKLPWGAVVFDHKGQNVCISNCLTQSTGEDQRQLIYFPDGHLRYSWVYPGAIIF